MTQASVIFIKATAILAGILADQARNNSVSPRMQSAAEELACLLAALTSSNAAERKSAKTRVRELAMLGHWKPPLPSPASSRRDPINAAGAQPLLPPKKRSGTWSHSETDTVVLYWKAPDAIRNATLITELVQLTGRTALAIIIHLYRHGAITMDEGDRLCLATNTPRLLSETSITPLAGLDRRSAPGHTG